MLNINSLRQKLRNSYIQSNKLKHKSKKISVGNVLKMNRPNSKTCPKRKKDGNICHAKLTGNSKFCGRHNKK